MQCTVHHKVLDDIFTNKINSIASGVITTSLLGVTKLIIEEYNNNLKSNQLFTAWFAHASQCKRFKHVANGNRYLFPDLSGMHSDYLLASFYSGLKFITSVNETVNAVDKVKLQNCGIDVMTVANLTTPPYYGDNPVEYIRLIDGGNVTPYVLKKYFVKENKIIVYDKYFKAAGLYVITNLCKYIDPNATITIITSRPPNSLSDTTINKAIKTECPEVTVNIKYMSNKAFSDTHDRYIFIGDRYVIKFTKGIDCFYKRFGQWVNKTSDVIVEDNHFKYSNYVIELDDMSSICVRLSA